MADENENNDSMEYELEIEFQFDEEEEEYDVEVVEEEGVEIERDKEEEEEDEEEEEIEELEEMTSPRISCWLGPDGKTYKGVMVVDDDVNNPGSKCQYDDCSVCYEQMTNRGKHRVSCLPCGHLYGFSCIKKWLLQSSSSRKCPQCNFGCTYKDVVPLQASTLCVRAHQKASSTKYFPFSKQGYIDFKEHEWSRHLDAQKRYDDDSKRLINIVKQQDDLEKQQAAMRESQWDNLVARGKALDQRAKELGQPVDELEGADAVSWEIDELVRRHGALGRRHAALERHAEALWRRTDVLKQRSQAYELNLKFFNEMYKEHLGQQKNTEVCDAHTS